MTARLPLLMFMLAASAATADWHTDAKLFLQATCSDCHGHGSDEGGFDLDSLSSELHQPEVFADWERVFDRVENGQMPPEGSDQPTDDSRRTFLKGIHDPLTVAHQSFKSTTLRRLNRREYQNTMNDLFGVDLDLESLLPEDGRSHEFDNVGASLGLSMVHLERYLEAIETVLDTAIADHTKPPERKVTRVSYADTREGERFIGETWKKLDDGAVVFYQDFGYPTGMLRGTDFEKPGRYKIRVKAYAHQSDMPITFRVGGTSFARGSDKPTYGYFTAHPLASNNDEPTIVELEAWIDSRYMIELTPMGLTVENYNIRKDGVDAYTGRGLAVLNVEMDGPIVDQFPSRGHRLIFDGINRCEIEPSNPSQKAKPWYTPRFEIHSETPLADARQSLTRIATAAFRHRVDDASVQPYVELFEASLSDGDTFEDALRTSVSAIFCSPEFLFLQEDEGQLSDSQLAARLSYFLNRTTPAPNAAIRNPGVKRNTADAQRLMDSPLFDRFVVDFTDAWLNLRDIDFTNPDQKLYPEYDAYLQDSAIKETRAFFRHLIDKNLPAANLVHSNFAMLNERLASHYEIAGVHGPEIRPVTLPRSSVRGGLLSQASILKVSANGTNTSPVVRGVWVTERILGVTPQPPPPGIPGVEPDIRGAATLRELLAKHRDSDNCRTCHALIDPPGFAMESFNPIGGWRDQYRSLGDGQKVDLRIKNRRVQYRLAQPVDASGETADGRAFAGFAEFRDNLARDEDRLARTLITKLATFATGRELGFSDRDEISRLVLESKRLGHGVRDIIDLVAGSSIFQEK